MPPVRSSDGDDKKRPASSTTIRLEGRKVFFFHPMRAWELATVMSTFNDARTGAPSVRLRSERDGENLDLVVKPSNMYLHTPGVENEAPHNLLTLAELHHSTLLHSLKLRHQQDLVYTHIGELLVAFNPFKHTIPWYQDEMMPQYTQYIETPQLPSDLRPHSWGTAHRAYVDMCHDHRNRSIVISGESGSGKTETCKILLRYLCEISLKKCSGNAAAAHRAAIINRRVQQSSPILEALGNAKTVRNDNSSRFGKFMEIQFNSSGMLIGMRVTPFLLEKSRVISCGQDERIFHCFYQLVAGAPADLRAEMRIRSAKDFRQLSRGNCITVRGGPDDEKEFRALVAALDACGFSKGEQLAIWHILAAILHLQNVDFIENRAESRAELSPTDEELCRFIAEDLLSLSNASEFSQCLTIHTTKVRGESVSKFLSKQKAEDQRDTICKHLYQQLFYWVVEKLNILTAAGADLDDETPSAEAPAGGDAAEAGIDTMVESWIGLLDIFGFEDFQANSFEQFCINLANEALQRHYTRHIFVRDVEEMRNEGISAEKVKFRDNQPCLDLMMGHKDSVVSLLDDASTLDLERAQTNPNFTFLHKLTMHFRPDFQTAGNKGSKSVLDRAEKMDKSADFFFRGRLDDDSFTVRHYASDVKYKVLSFVEKNTDNLKDAALSVLKSDNTVVSEVITMDVDSVGLLGDGQSPMSPMTSPARGGGFSGGSSVVKKTVASQFRNSLRQLMEMVDTTVPNWIRCIRPHPRKAPGLFDGKTILEQLVATGVLETIEQRQRNFPFRMMHDDFLTRYGVVAFGALQKMGGRLSNKERCTTVLVTAGVAPENGQVGRSKVFLRTEAQRALEVAREHSQEKFTLTLHCFARLRQSRQEVCLLRWRAQVHNVQRIFRTTIKLRKCARAYYKELQKRVESRLADERKSVAMSEAVVRQKIETATDQLILDEYKLFRKLLIPLVADVLKNIVIVEAQRRAQLEKTEGSVSLTFTAQFQEGVADAQVRRRERIAKDVEKAQLQRNYLRDLFLSVRGEIMDEEERAREHLVSVVILPQKAEIDSAASQVADRINRRNRQLRALLEERDREIQRLQDARQRKIAKESQTWVRHVGEDGLAEDVRYLARDLGLPPNEVEAHIRAFYQFGGPSSVVSGPVIPAAHKQRYAQMQNISSLAAREEGGGSPSASSSPGLYRRLQGAAAPKSPIGAVRNYRDYAEHWRNEFDTHTQKQAAFEGRSPATAPSHERNHRGVDDSFSLSRSAPFGGAAEAGGPSADNPSEMQVSPTDFTPASAVIRQQHRDKTLVGHVGRPSSSADILDVARAYTAAHRGKRSSAGGGGATAADGSTTSARCTSPMGMNGGATPTASTPSRDSHRQSPASHTLRHHQDDGSRRTWHSPINYSSRCTPMHRPASCASGGSPVSPGAVGGVAQRRQTPPSPSTPTATLAGVGSSTAPPSAFRAGSL